MGDDVKLQIILEAQNNSAQAFADIKRDVQGFSGAIDGIKNTIQGLIGAGGVLMALRQAFSMAVDGSAMDNQARAFDNLSKSVGANSQEMLDSLKKASRGMVAEADIVKAAGTAMMMGINPADLTKMMQIAEATSRQTGQSVTEAFNDISLGMARQSKMIMDNLGIVVEVEKGYERYAATLGKATDALTDAEKRQAFNNEVMSKGEELIRRIGNSEGTLIGVNKLIASQSNLWDEVSKSVAMLLDKELTAYASAIDWITEKIKKMASDSKKATEDAAVSEIKMLESLVAKGMASEEALRAARLKYGITVPGEHNEFGRGNVNAGPLDVKAPRLDHLIPSEAELKALSEMEIANIRKRNEEIDRLNKQSADNYKKLLEERRDLAEKFAEMYDKQTLSSYEFELRELQKVLDKMVAKGAITKEQMSEYIGQYKLNYFQNETPWNKEEPYWQRPYQESEAFLADQKAWETWKAQRDKDFNELVTMSQRTSEAVEQTFADLTFDAFTGKLKTLEDYFKAFANSIARILSDIVGQMAKTGLFGSDGKGGWLGSLFGGSGGSSGASGGVIDLTHGSAAPAMARGMFGGGGAPASATSVQINNYTGEKATVQEKRGAGGTRDIMVMIGRDIAAGGPMARAMELRYPGLRPAGRRA